VLTEARYTLTRKGPPVTLDPLQTLVSSFLPVALTCALVYVLYIVFVKHKIAVVVGLFICAVIGTAAVAAIKNYETTGPAVLALLGL
jgi:hypothetical protein